MVNLQSEFINFHDAIKLTEEDDTLREKRNILLNKLKANISDEAAPYTYFNQGSYAMHTGIKPDDGDYDIDVGLKFDINREDYTDPLEAKKWVRDALEGHTKSVKIRRSCVTVTYQKDDEPIYHVDFAVYAANNDDGKLYIAKGKEFSTEENRYWEESDPQELLNHINSLYDDADDRSQFRRCIRYAKKWKNQKFDLSGNAAPTGIALTALACSYFKPTYIREWTTQKKAFDDFNAFHSFMKSIKKSFILTWDSENGRYYHKISCHLPVAPYNDLFAKMTSKQMNEFYEEVESLLGDMDRVTKQTKRSEACKILVSIFGNDFPVTVDRSYVGTSESA